VIIAARAESMPLTARRGEPVAAVPISACTSPSIGRLPSSVTVTAVPETGAGADPGTIRKDLQRTRFRCRATGTADLVGSAETVLDAADHAQRR